MSRNKEVGWTEKQVWQPFWEGVIFPFAFIVLSFSSLHFVGYAPLSDSLALPFGLVLIFIILFSGIILLASLFNTERLKVVKE